MADNDYFRRRTVEELAAAEWATCEKARRVNRELAVRYLRQIENGSPVLNLHPRFRHWGAVYQPSPPSAGR